MTRRIALILSLLSAAALTGCGGGGSNSQSADTVNVAVNMEPAEPTQNTVAPAAQVVGHVSNIFDGENAYVGTVKAMKGAAIHLNEHFYTGAGTKMEVTLDKDGSIILLDQNTDPNFFAAVSCFWIRLTSGMMTVRNKNPMCVEAGSAKVNQHSYVLYQANEGVTTIAVFEGEVTTISPQCCTARTGQILTVQNGETTGLRPMDQDTINKLQAWIPRIIL